MSNSSRLMKYFIRTSKLKFLSGLRNQSGIAITVVNSLNQPWSQN